MSKESRFELREDFRELTIIDGETYLEYEQKSLNDFNDLYYLLNDLSNQKSDLEVKLAEKESEADQRYKDWQEEIRECDGLRVVLSEVRKQLAEKENEIKVGEFWHSAYQGKQLDYDKVYAELRQAYDENTQLKQQLSESEKKHLLDEKEWQDYCAFKHIEPQIKGCLDREREYEKQLAESEEQVKIVEKQHSELLMTIFDGHKENFELKQQLADTEEQNKRVLEKLELIVSANQELEQKLAEKDKEISNLKGLVNERDKQIKNLKTNKKRVVEHKNKVKISFAVEQLEKVKEELEFTSNNNEWITARDDRILNGICDFIDNQIKAIKEMK